MHHLLKALLLLSAVASSSVRADPIEVSLSDETFSDTVKVSGHIRAGVMYRSSDNHTLRLPPESIILDLGQIPHDTVCGKIISMDGKYEASFSTDSLAGRKGRVQLQLKSRFGKLEEYDSGAITVLAYESDPSCRKILRILPAAWYESSADSDTLTVLLNAGSFDTSLLLYPKGKRRPESLPCRKIESGQSVAYDTLCEIERLSDYDLTRSRIKRRNANNFARAVKLPIHLMSTDQKISE